MSNRRTHRSYDLMFWLNEGRHKEHAVVQADGILFYLPTKNFILKMFIFLFYKEMRFFKQARH
jgi:hypothetical protein